MLQVCVAMLIGVLALLINNIINKAAQQDSFTDKGSLGLQSTLGYIHSRGSGGMPSILRAILYTDCSITIDCSIRVYRFFAVTKIKLP